jgi:hypothetical protein
MSFKAYEEFAAEPLAFEIKGKTYVVPELGIDAGLKFAGVFAGKDKSLDKAPIEDLFRLILGDMWDQMKTDAVPINAALRVGYSALADLQEGREAAEAVWESGFDPKALAEFAERKANPPKPASQPSSNTASARKTPPRAATKRTTSPRVTQPRKSAAKRAAPSVGPS